MSKEIKGKEPDPRDVYGDIIDLPHWQSPSRPRMSLYDRAAQFAPFAALTGYDEMIGEEARLVDNRIELSADDLAMLSRKLDLIARAVDAGDHPLLSVVCFIPDPLKAGGRYETVTEKIKKVDAVRRTLVLEKRVGVAGSNAEIPISDVLDIHGDLVDSADF